MIPPAPVTAPPSAAVVPPAAAALPEATAVPLAAAAGAAAGAVAAAGADQPPTYLNPQSAPPPAANDPPGRPDRYATLPGGSLPPAPLAPPPAPVMAPDPRTGSASSSAFASAWADAHDKLTAGRYAEALSGLSVWYDDPSLGLEESQRLEDLLGQLAGTVIYSQQDLLLAPHVVAPGETLDAVAAPLGVSPQLLAKINGVDDPARLVPGEHLKVIRGPFDAVVSISRRRLSLQLAGNYAGSFPVLVGRQFLGRVGGSLPVTEVARAGAAGTASLRRSVVLAEGLVIEAVDDVATVSDNVPPSSLIVSVRDLDELLDILGPGSRILVRQ
jgi:LysM repeat protein